jgi:glucose/arabinose dehydrogenase
MLRTVLASLVAVSAAALSPAAAQAHSAPVEHRALHFPALRVTRLVTGLDHPWDVRPIGDGRLLFTQRDRATVSLWDGSRVREIDGFPTGSVWVSGETGLMGLETAPDFAQTRRFYTCQGGTTAHGHDVEIMSWTLTKDLTTIASSKKLLGGLPATSGRHGGCRILAYKDDLFVGTGDAATGTNPENKKSLGGKVLRLVAATGKPYPGNPFHTAGNRHKRYVWTYGHRNVQGLTFRRDGSGGVWSIEQGTYRDDEVNVQMRGADYGYNPVPGYNESVPMTDHSLPGRQVGAVWRSGDPTLATSGGDFVYGKRWGAYDGTLAVAALKGERVLFLRLQPTSDLAGVHTPPALRKYGRIRTVVDGPGSVFYVTTDNGNGGDAILAVRPAAH